MQTRWNKLQEQLKERDLVRMHFDIPTALRHRLRLAACQDVRRLRDLYIEALTDYLDSRETQRKVDKKRHKEPKSLKLDTSELEG